MRRSRQGSNKAAMYAIRLHDESRAVGALHNRCASKAVHKDMIAKLVPVCTESAWYPLPRGTLSVLHYVARTCHMQWCASSGVED